MPKKIIMSEDAYIAISNLTKSRNALDVLRHITPGIGEHIPEKEYNTVMRTITRWTQSIESAIETNIENLGVITIADTMIPCVECGTYHSIYGLHDHSKKTS